MEAVARIDEAFSVQERVLLLNGALPQQGNITSIRLLRRFREALSFSEDEHATLKIREEGAILRWDPKAAEGHKKTIPIGPKIRELLATGLMAVSNAGQLSDQHLDLCDRFLAEEEDEEGAA